LKKICVFPGIVLILFFVFACTMPSEIEITGSPSIKFAANMDLGDFFSDMISSTMNTGDNEVKVLDCTNSSLKYKTYLLYIDAFTGEKFDFEMDESKFVHVGNTGEITINDKIINLVVVAEGGGGNNTILEVIDSDCNKDITSSDVKPYPISSSGFGDYLEGFEFSGIKAKMYLSGSEFVKAIDIKLYQTDSEGNKIKQISSNTPPMKKSGVESLKEYNDPDLPPGGEDIDISEIINSKEDSYISYEIRTKKKENKAEIELEALREQQFINIEIVIWLPMTFESEKENACFNFNGFFDGIGNVFKSVSGTGFIESMSIKIGIQPLNPFGDGIFYIKDDNYSIISPMDDNSFSFDLEKEDIEYINDNSFEPSFLILYPKKYSFLGIPNEDIMITTVSLEAELKYNVEF
jgi:hypothetical protein